MIFDFLFVLLNLMLSLEKKSFKVVCWSCNSVYTTIFLPLFSTRNQCSKANEKPFFKEPEPRGTFSGILFHKQVVKLSKFYWPIAGNYFMVTGWTIVILKSKAKLLLEMISGEMFIGQLSVRVASIEWQKLPLENGEWLRTWTILIRKLTWRVTLIDKKINKNSQSNVNVWYSCQSSLLLKNKTSTLVKRMATYVSVCCKVVCMSIVLQCIAFLPIKKISRR